MDLRDLILAFPSQIIRGVDLGQTYRIAASQKRIIACGMGGSGVPGEIMAMLDERIVVWHDFSLPSDINKEDLVVCISWSGNTAETISAYQAARELGIDTLVITKKTSELGRLMVNDNVPHIDLPEEAMPPRFAAGYLVAAFGAVLGMGDQLKTLALNPARFEAEGERIADTISKRIPSVYVSRSVRALGPLWKMLFNENAKVHADWNSFPELVHNELAEFSAHDGDGYLPIILKNPAEKPDILDTMSRTIAFLEGLGYTVSTVTLSGSTILEQVLNGYILGLWTSCALAHRLGADPLDTQIIEAFKSINA